MILRDNDAIAALYADLGQRIATARLNAGLTQDALGRVVGLTRASITNIEAGKQMTPLHTLLAICEAVGVSLPVLLDGAPVEGATQASAAARAAALTAQTIDRIEQVQRDARKLDGVLGELLADLALPAGGEPR